MLPFIVRTSPEFPSLCRLVSRNGGLTLRLDRRCSVVRLRAPVDQYLPGQKATNQVKPSLSLLKPACSSSTFLLYKSVTRFVKCSVCKHCHLQKILVTQIFCVTSLEDSTAMSGSYLLCEEASFFVIHLVVILLGCDQKILPF